MLEETIVWDGERFLPASYLRKRYSMNALHSLYVITHTYPHIPIFLIKGSLREGSVSGRYWKRSIRLSYRTFQRKFNRCSMTFLCLLGKLSPPRSLWVQWAFGCFRIKCFSEKDIIQSPKSVTDMIYNRPLFSFRVIVHCNTIYS